MEGISGKPVLNTEAIMNLLPHRYPFILIDSIEEYIEGERIVGRKNVSYNEWYFCGHFPEKPVMPGVLILEAMAQTGVVFAKLMLGEEGKDILFYFAGVKECKWKKQVKPGDVLILELTEDRVRRPVWSMKGKAFVNGELACSATLVAAEGTSK